MPDRSPLKLAVAAPCSARWEDMDGDARTRFCAQCRKRVHDLSQMTRAEIDALAAQGPFCGKLYRRADGTVLTADCPVGLRERARALGRRVTAVALGLAAILGLGALGNDEIARPPEPEPVARLPVPQRGPPAFPAPAAIEGISAERMQNRPRLEPVRRAHTIGSIIVVKGATPTR